LSAAALDPRIARGLEAQLRTLREREAAGERRVGWKIALNDPRVQSALGIERPVIGFLASGSSVDPETAHSLDGTAHPAIEPEIAVHVGAGGTIAGLGPALEVIDVDQPFDDLEQVMAGNVFHRAVVLGPVTDGLDRVDGMHARFRCEGEAEQAIDVAASAMPPDEVVALVSGYLGAVGESLRAGDVIIAGSLIPALPAAPGRRFRLDVDQLGTVALRFSSP
jgi:2-keto-4-pentenoate hydratase